MFFLHSALNSLFWLFVAAHVNPSGGMVLEKEREHRAACSSAAFLPVESVSGDHRAAQQFAEEDRKEAGFPVWFQGSPL